MKALNSTPVVPSKSALAIAILSEMGYPKAVLEGIETLLKDFEDQEDKKTKEVKIEQPAETAKKVEPKSKSKKAVKINEDKKTEVVKDDNGSEPTPKSTVPTGIRKVKIFTNKNNKNCSVTLTREFTPEEVEGFKALAKTTTATHLTLTDLENATAKPEPKTNDKKPLSDAQLEQKKNAAKNLRDKLKEDRDKKISEIKKNAKHTETVKNGKNTTTTYLDENGKKLMTIRNGKITLHK